MKFSQIKQRVGDRFKQRIVPFVNGAYGIYAKLRTGVGHSIVIDDASDEALCGLRIFGKSTQDGTPTPDAPVEIVSVENPTVKVDAQSISVPYTLHGIPVTSGGNYTDANGQQWICDEVDFGHGVHIQRIISQVVSETDISSVDNRYFSTGGTQVTVRLSNSNRIDQHNVSIISDRAKGVSQENRSLNSDTSYRCYTVQAANTMNFRYPINSGEKSLADAKSDFTGAIVIYILDTPIETPLTAAQIEAYKALHTNEPNTTISNDKDAWMEVNYISN